MRDFACHNCGQQLVFENSVCLNCDSPVGYSLADHDVLVIHPERFQPCANLNLAACNWLVPAGDEAGLCESCALTRTRPADTDAEFLPLFAEAETAKRRLVAELHDLGLPLIGRAEDPQAGLAFDLLSSANENVVIGHADGVITLDLAEGDDAHREQMRAELAEPYRTLLGHFRHESGHYYYTVLVTDDGVKQQFTDLFGDPDADYQAALDRHYSEGAPAGWEDAFVSSYATMHAAEDWAETFAHYLHIRDTLDTAAAFGFAPAGVSIDKPKPGRVGFDQLIEQWLPLAWSLNMVNRSMGHPDLYPFVLPPKVLDKMAFAHELVASRGQGNS